MSRADVLLSAPAELLPALVASLPLEVLAAAGPLSPPLPLPPSRLAGSELLPLGVLLPLAFRISDPGSLELLASDPRPAVRDAVCANPSLPSDLAAGLLAVESDLSRRRSLLARVLADGPVPSPVPPAAELVSALALLPLVRVLEVLSGSGLPDGPLQLLGEVLAVRPELASSSAPASTLRRFAAAVLSSDSLPPLVPRPEPSSPLFVALSSALEVETVGSDVASSALLRLEVQVPPLLLPAWSEALRRLLLPSSPSSSLQLPVSSSSPPAGWFASSVRLLLSSPSPEVVCSPLLLRLLSGSFSSADRLPVPVVAGRVRLRLGGSLPSSSSPLPPAVAELVVRAALSDGVEVPDAVRVLSSLAVVDPGADPEHLRLAASVLLASPDPEGLLDGLLGLVPPRRAGRLLLRLLSSPASRRPGWLSGRRALPFLTGRAVAAGDEVDVSDLLPLLPALGAGGRLRLLAGAASVLGGVDVRLRPSWWGPLEGEVAGDLASDPELLPALLSEVGDRHLLMQLLPVLGRLLPSGGLGLLFGPSSPLAPLLLPMLPSTLSRWRRAEVAAHGGPAPVPVSDVVVSAASEFLPVPELLSLRGPEGAEVRAAALAASVPPSPRVWEVVAALSSSWSGPLVGLVAAACRLVDGGEPAAGV